MIQVPTSAIDAYLGERLPDRFHRETFQYFGQEIFSALTPARQNLLMRSSILERLDPEILRDLFQEEGGLVLLKEMTRKNLFVRAFPDPAEGVVFRYHQLFKDFLGARLRSQVSEEEFENYRPGPGPGMRKRGI